MARFLFCTVPIVGHIRPGLPVARELVARGHEVRWYTGGKYRAMVEATGAGYEPMRAAPDYDDDDIESTFPGLAGRTGLSALKGAVRLVFVDSAAAQLADVQDVLSRFPADVLVAETAFVGAIFAAELGGPPRAVYGVTPLTMTGRECAPFGLGLPPSTGRLGRLRNRAIQVLFDRVLFRDVNVHYTRARAGVGLPPPRGGALDDALSPHLYLQGTVPSFEYPRSDLPPQVHFVGPLLPGAAPDFDPPPWWDELDAGRPVVHVTQGTVATDPGQLLVPTLRGLAGADVLVVATTGGRPVETLPLAPLPANVRVAPFIPHACLLPKVDVMVTNGGYGGVQIALANGVPLVAAGRTEDKVEVGARVAWAGVGVDLKTNRPAPEQVGRAVRTILADPRYRRNARRIAADMARHDPPAEAATLLERLAATGRPVTAAPAVPPG